MSGDNGEKGTETKILIQIEDTKPPKYTGVSWTSLEVRHLKARVSFPGFLIKHEILLLYIMTGE